MTIWRETGWLEQTLTSRRREYLELELFRVAETLIGDGETGTPGIRDARDITSYLVSRVGSTIYGREGKKQRSICFGSGRRRHA